MRPIPATNTVATSVSRRRLRARAVIATVSNPPGRRPAVPTACRIWTPSRTVSPARGNAQYLEWGSLEKLYVEFTYLPRRGPHFREGMTKFRLLLVVHKQRALRPCCVDSLGCDDPP